MSFAHDLRFVIFTPIGSFASTNGKVTVTRKNKLFPNVFCATYQPMVLIVS